jgi:dihydrofolate reductase
MATTSGFTLLCVASEDGYIARGDGDLPATWASPEEQALFSVAVASADWSVVGRVTHKLAYRPDRRRIVFSRSAATPQWRTPTHLWIDPDKFCAADLAPLVAHVAPLRDGLILGGVGVHDWFHAQDAMEAVRLTVEPLRFGSGLPIFSDQTPGDAVGAFLEKGWDIVTEERLNRGGTRLLTLVRRIACAGDRTAVTTPDAAFD